MLCVLAFLSVLQTQVYCVCLDHVITLSHCNLTAKRDTVPTHKTHYFTIRMNSKKCLTGRLKKKNSNLIFSILQTACGRTSAFSQMYFLKDHSRLMVNLFVWQINRAKSKTGSVILPHIPSSCIWVDSWIVQIKLTIRSLFNWFHLWFDGFISFHIT